MYNFLTLHLGTFSSKDFKFAPIIAEDDLRESHSKMYFQIPENYSTAIHFMGDLLSKDQANSTDGKWEKVERWFGEGGPPGHGCQPPLPGL